MILIGVGVVAFLVWSRWPMTEGLSRTTKTPEELPTAAADSMALLIDDIANPREWRRAKPEQIAQWPEGELLRYRVWHSVTENRMELGHSIIVLNTIGRSAVFPERALEWIAPGISWELGHHCGRHAAWFFVHSGTGTTNKPIVMNVEFRPGPRSPIRPWQVEDHTRVRDLAELDRITGGQVELLTD
ncbi:hypothetical protein AB0N05_37670 [Nocardia sp. NPDC051030]|uniref:hypothetical protein n=1 Tax=Nocardia sp. NPDC051030 TaxID=3155162 RepID=UPI00343D4F6E